MPPGSPKGLQLVVPDIHKAHAELVERGVEVTDVQVLSENPVPGGDPLDNVGFVFFSDPDGNGWGVQQISARARPTLECEMRRVAASHSPGIQAVFSGSSAL